MIMITEKMNGADWGRLLAVLAALIVVSGCGKEKECETVCTVCPKESANGHAAGDAPVPVSTVEDRALVKCEHKVSMYQCDECRYQAGLVKVDPDLLKREGGTGVMGTQAVTRTRIVSVLPATGEVALNENTTVHISPRITGIIESVSADIGMRVKEGDTLLTLASVELGKAMAEYERNATLAELSERTFQRETMLKEQKVSSEQDMINARMAYEQYRAEFKASGQALRVLGLSDGELAALRQPQAGTGRGILPVRAPASGTIIEKHAVTGEMAEAGENLMLLADLTTVWVWANVHSRDLALLLSSEKQGPVAVEITVSAFPGRKFPGRLDYIGATMNEQTRTVKVRASVANPELLLRPGMFCEASIAVANSAEEAVLAVPAGAVMSDEGKSFVFKTWRDGFFVRQDVRTGRVFAGLVEVLEGLQEGEAVVTDGAFMLKSDVLREKMGAGCAD